MHFIFKYTIYYSRFIRDFDFAINNSFEQIYAIASSGSKTSAQDFINFCEKVNIPLKKINADLYFKKGSVETAFLTQECSFDFAKIRDFLVNKVKDLAYCYYGVGIQSVEKGNPSYVVNLDNGTCLAAPFVINASYAGINEVIDKFDKQLFDLKYELCEMVFCKVQKDFKNLGITVMDGDFFSVVPFGNSGFHVLTSVGYTPYDVSYDKIPKFSNEADQSICKIHGVSECIVCSQNLKSAWSKMYELSRAFLKPNFKIEYKNSKFEIKAILRASENDDSRPTIIRQHTANPTFVSILSGKISTIYDLENICEQPEYSETPTTKVSFISK